jgi:hypothetical protein
MLRPYDEESHWPSDSGYATPPTDRCKCGAECVPFCDEDSSSINFPVKEIKFEKRGLAQEQSAFWQCASHVTPILHRPALRYPFSDECSNSIPSSVKQIQAPQSKHIANDEDEWEVVAEYATHHQQAMDAHEIVDDIYRHAKKYMHESGMVMQPDYVGKPEDPYLWCLIR